MALTRRLLECDFSGVSQGRDYIRHPARMPIEVKCSSSLAQLNLQLNNVSEGGLSFVSPNAFHRGSVVDIKIPVRPVFRVHGVVQWCRALTEGFELGVEFLDRDDAYRVRMVQQVCRIEMYRQELQLRSGKRVSKERASKEWIEKYAESFPK